jgi:hypothetical protein
MSKCIRNYIRNSMNNSMNNSIRNYSIRNYSIRNSIRKGIRHDMEYICAFSLDIPA